jgi:predicted aldo/keto reductase-like oxidoreductase
MKGRRDEVFLATKFCNPTGHLQAGSPVSEYMRVVEDSLRRLHTDRVDLVHIHACDSEGRLLDENVHEAFDRLREQGKARFLGVSTHTPNLERVVESALESQRFDVLMLAYHHGAWPRLPALIERAAAADVGVVAMKTLKGAYHEGLLELTQQEQRSYPQAAFRWVLANPAVSALVISFSKARHLDEYLAASGQAPKHSDVALLAKYDRLISGVHCMPHCGACLDSCPVGLPIDDILRYRMYFENYGDQKGAMRMYAALERKADACVGCAAPCASRCPVGVPIAERLRETHRMLS